MSAPRFKPGDKVTVRWMDETVEATVVELLLVNGRPHKTPEYRLRLDGVDWNVGYREDEIARAAGCE